ncbi:MAG: zinc ribbon domain-containing protein [Chloroflexi bacterium]|nr:zinc ribbon domain-containing protein [Chloroflexota bacterium]
MSESPVHKGLFCPECGTQNPPGAKFCQNCGQPMPVPQTQSQKQETPVAEATAQSPASPPTVVVVQQGEEGEEEKKSRGWLWFLLGLVLVLGLLVCGTTTQVIQVSPVPANSQLPPFLANTINQLAAWQQDLDNANNRNGDGGGNEPGGAAAFCGPQGDWISPNGETYFFGLQEFDAQSGEIMLWWMFDFQGASADIALDQSDTYLLSYSVGDQQTGNEIASSEFNGIYECEVEPFRDHQVVCKTPYQFLNTNEPEDLDLLVEESAVINIELKYGEDSGCVLATDQIEIENAQDASLAKVIQADGQPAFGGFCGGIQSLELEESIREAINNQEYENIDQLVFTGLEGDPEASFSVYYYTDSLSLNYECSPPCSEADCNEVWCPYNGGGGITGFILTAENSACVETRTILLDETLAQDNPNPEQESGEQTDNVCSLPEFGQGKISLVSGYYEGFPYQVPSSPFDLRFSFGGGIPSSTGPDDYSVEATINGATVPTFEDCYQDPAAEENQLYCKLLPGLNQAGTLSIDLFVNGCSDPLLHAQSPLGLRTFEPTVTPTRKPPREPEAGQELACPAGESYHGPTVWWSGGCCTDGYWCTLPGDSEAGCWNNCP